MREEAHPFDGGWRSIGEVQNTNPETGKPWTTEEFNNLVVTAGLQPRGPFVISGEFLSNDIAGMLNELEVGSNARMTAPLCDGRELVVELTVTGKRVAQEGR